MGVLTENFKYRIEKRIGAPRRPILPTLDQMKYFESHFPSSFCDFIDHYGIGSYFQNGVQFVDPQEFKPLAALLFGDDPDFSHKDCHIVSYSAFGKLELWSERHWEVSIDLLQYQLWSDIFPTEFDSPLLVPEPGAPKPSAERMAISVMPSDEDDRECWDIDDEPMFERCVKAYGALQTGECFGFFPSLGVAGYNSKYRSVEHVKRVKALEHFCIIAQMRPLMLTRLGRDDYEYKRAIGNATAAQE